MTKRKIIKIHEDKCNGCGLCIPNCPEGALQVIDGKVRLISDLFCDGLGACIGYCPEGAIEVEEREAESYDEKKVMDNVVKQGENTIKAHLIHLKEHNQTEFFNQAVEYLEENNFPVPNLESEEKTNGPTPCGCPGAQMRQVQPSGSKGAHVSEQASELTQWPVQLTLLPVNAPFFDNAHLLIAADCVPFAFPNFHSKLLAGKSLAIGCPKMDDLDSYNEKLTEIFKTNKIKSITVAIMEVPCCTGLLAITQEAIADSGKDIPLIKEVVMINGELQ